MMFPDRLSTLRIYSAACIALPLGIAPAGASTPAASANPPAARDAIVIAQGENTGPSKSIDPRKLSRKHKGKAGMEVRGANVERMHGKSAGQGKETARGAQFISRDQWRQMEKPPETGLYIVDADFVPLGLMQDLKNRGYKLQEDGTLTRLEKPVTLFISPETYRMKVDKDADLPEDAADPVPWKCISTYWAVHYGRDSCFLFDAWTGAFAWGADSSGECGSTSSPAKLESIQTYVMVGDISDDTIRHDAHASYAGVSDFLACHWPGRSKVDIYSSQYWKDGGASIFRYRRWD